MSGRAPADRRRSYRSIEGDPATSSQVDWAHLHALVEDVGRRLEAGSDPDPEQAARELQRRARALARPVEQAVAESRVELLILDLGGRRLGLETRFVVEVVRHPPTAPLPGATPPVAAVAAWRGRILTSLDLRPPRQPSPAGSRSSVLVAIGRDRAEVGLLVDRAETVIALPLSALLPIPAGPMVWGDYIRAITEDALPVLDGEAILHRHPPDP